jgi:hypothetical protein
MPTTVMSKSTSPGSVNRMTPLCNCLSGLSVCEMPVTKLVVPVLLVVVVVLVLPKQAKAGPMLVPGKSAAYKS